MARGVRSKARQNQNGEKDREGHVYFIRARCEPPLIRIGFTTDPRNRLLRLRATSPVPLEPIALLAGTLAIERGLHERFSPAWSHGEWFHATEELLAFIAAEAQAWKPPGVVFDRRPIAPPKQQTVKEWAEVTTWTHRGRTATVARWSKLTGLTAYQIRIALRRGRTFELEWKADRIVHRLPLAGWPPARPSAP